MDAEQLAAFIRITLNDNSQADSQVVQNLFQRFDDDKDGFLTEENFLTFYYQASASEANPYKAPGPIWMNLRNHYYGIDLKRFDEIEFE